MHTVGTVLRHRRRRRLFSGAAVWPSLLVVAAACGPDTHSLGERAAAGSASLSGPSQREKESRSVTLAPLAGGRYLPGSFDQAGFVSVGQGQAGWLAFDLAPLAGSRVRSMSLGFTQVGTTNPQLFPNGLTVKVYDVSTPFDRLIVDRIPIDAEGDQIAADLHSGHVYLSLVVAPDGEGRRYQQALDRVAQRDLQAAIDRGDETFSIGLASVPFDAGGYFTPDSATLEVMVCAGEVEREGEDDGGCRASHHRLELN